jgi:hypothetical protein
MMDFKNEFENEEDNYPGVEDKLGFIRKTLVFLCSVQNNYPMQPQLPWYGMGRSGVVCSS